MNDARNGRPGAALLLAAAVLLVFSPLRHAGFINYDDTPALVDNPLVSGGLTWAGLAWAFTDVSFTWQPLTWLSHMFDFQLFGANPAAHHAVSVLLHAANTALLFHLLARLTAAPARSAVAAALFAFHPLRVEPVAWISARNELLGTLFFLGGLLAHVRRVEHPGPSRSALVAVALVLGLMSKGTVVTLPFVLLLLDDWPLGRRPFGDLARALALVREKLPLFALALAGMAVQIANKSVNRSLWSLGERPLPVRAASALVNYAWYLGRTVWPAGLALPYPLTPGFPPASAIAAAAACLGAVSALVVLAARRHPYLRTGWLWYAVTLLPVAGLVQIGSQSAADRYTYVPLIGVFVALVWGGADLAAARRLPPWAARAAAAGALLACVGLTSRQLAYWRDSITLFRHSVAVTEGNFQAQNNLGAALSAAGREDEAFEFFVASLRSNPAGADAHSSLGAALMRRGDFDAAEEHLRESVRLDPGAAQSHSNLGALLMKRGRTAEAAEHLREAVRLNPHLLSARLNLGGALLQGNDPAAAREQFAAAVAIRPLDPFARYMMAQSWEGEGRAAEALSEYERAVALDPGLVGARYRLARLLEASGRRDGAAAHYREVLRLDPGHAAAGAALARLPGEGR